MPNNPKGILFRVATQLGKDDLIHIRSLRVFSSETVQKFAERVLGYKMDDCAFAEIHQIMDNGTVKIIYGDKDKMWPKVATVNHDVVFGQKPDTNNPHTFTPDPLDKAIATVLGNEPAPVIIVPVVSAPVVGEAVVRKVHQFNWSKVA